LAEREPWELSNEESFSKRASGGAWATAFVSATIALLAASFELEQVVPQLPLCGAGEFGRHTCRSPVISTLFPDTPKIDPFTGMDGLERRGLCPRSQNRDVRIPETRRILDIPFEECIARRGYRRPPLGDRACSDPILSLGGK
jgi:hypothetical protein